MVAGFNFLRISFGTTTEAEQPETPEARRPGNPKSQETRKPRGQKAQKPESQEARKPRSQETQQKTQKQQKHTKIHSRPLGLRLVGSRPRHYGHNCRYWAFPSLSAFFGHIFAMRHCNGTATQQVEKGRSTETLDSTNLRAQHSEPLDPGSEVSDLTTSHSLPPDILNSQTPRPKSLACICQP